MRDSAVNLFALGEDLIHSIHLQIRGELEKQMEIGKWMDTKVHFWLFLKDL